MTENARFIMDYLDCNCEMFPTADNCAEAVRRYYQLLAEGKAGGFVPLIVVPDDELAETLRALGKLDRAEIIRDAKAVDAGPLLSMRLMDEWHQYVEKGQFTPAEPTGAFSGVAVSEGATVVLIAKIPAEHPWELAAWLPLGSREKSVTPTQQVAVLRHWHELYGAALCAASSESWQMTVAKPPQTDKDAEHAAREIFAFDTESIGQGYDTIDALASHLKGSATWAFWWD